MEHGGTSLGEEWWDLYQAWHGFLDKKKCSYGRFFVLVFTNKVSLKIGFKKGAQTLAETWDNGDILVHYHNVGNSNIIKGSVYHVTRWLDEDHWVMTKNSSRLSFMEYAKEYWSDMEALI